MFHTPCLEVAPIWIDVDLPSFMLEFIVQPKVICQSGTELSGN
jgi:hypothetical protein